MISHEKRTKRVQEMSRIFFLATALSALFHCRQLRLVYSDSPWRSNQRNSRNEKSTPRRLAGTSESLQADPAKVAAVNFMTAQEMSAAPYQKADAYSGMWWMNRDLFLNITTSQIDNLAGASWEAFHAVGSNNVVLTRDWLDFSVEHIPRAFQVVDHGDGQSFPQKKTILTRYMDQIETQWDGCDDAVTASTIAIIPIDAESGDVGFPLQKLFADNPKFRTATSALKLYSLAASLLSLWKIGIPRVVVVGSTEDMPAIVRGAFSVVQKSVVGSDRMTLTYQKGSSYPVYGDDGLPLMVQHAIGLLQQAMRSEMDHDKTIQWLGKNPSRWKFVYFTEPDTILHTRVSALGPIGKRLQQGQVITAHRLEPIPQKQIDIQDHEIHANFVVPSTDNTLGRVLYDLDSDTAACCDGGNRWPGQTDFTYCGTRYACNVRLHSPTILPPGTASASTKRQRLVSHPYVRLKQGLGVPLVSSHGRICLPAERGSCPVKVKST